MFDKNFYMPMFVLIDDQQGLSGLCNNFYLSIHSHTCKFGNVFHILTYCVYEKKWLVKTLGFDFRSWLFIHIYANLVRMAWLLWNFDSFACLSDNW